MLFQINRMDLAETGGEEEEEEGVEEEEVGDERRSGCGSLKFTHRMGADTPPCLHASRAGQLLGSVRRCLAALTCTIDKNKSRKPGSSPAFSPGSPTSSETTNRTYSASTSSPCGRKRATAAALVSSVPASGCPSCRRSSAKERSLLLPGRRGVESPRALLFKWRRLPRGAGRGAAATDRHAAALAWSRRYAAAVGFCTKNHCILVGMAGVGVSVRPGGGEGCGYRRSVSKSVASLYPRGERVGYCSRGAPFQTRTPARCTLANTHARARCTVLFFHPAASLVSGQVRAHTRHWNGQVNHCGDSLRYPAPSFCFFLKSPHKYLIHVLAFTSQ